MLDMLETLLLTIIFLILITEYHFDVGICSQNSNIEKDLVDELNKLKDEITQLKKTLEPKATRFTRAKSKDLIEKEAKLDILLRPFNIPSEGEKFYFYNDEDKRIEFKSLKDRIYFESRLKDAILNILKLSDREFFDFLKENIGLYRVELLMTPNTLQEYLQNKPELGDFIPRNIISHIYADVVVYYEYYSNTYYIYVPVTK